MPSTGLCASSCPFGVLVPIWKFWLALPGSRKFLMGTMAWGLILPLFSPLTKGTRESLLGCTWPHLGLHDSYVNPWKPLWNGIECAGWRSLCPLCYQAHPNSSQEHSISILHLIAWMFGCKDSKPLFLDKTQRQTHQMQSLQRRNKNWFFSHSFKSLIEWQFCWA
jgi:hypothetical protein